MNSQYVLFYLIVFDCGILDISCQLRKESLSSAGHQFHQYQQNEQSPLILNKLTENKKTMTYDVGNPGLALGQAPACGRVKPVNELHTLVLL